VSTLGSVTLRGHRRFFYTPPTPALHSLNFPENFVISIGESFRITHFHVRITHFLFPILFRGYSASFIR